MKRILLCVLLAACAGRVLAHEVRPAYLELRQTGAATYDVLWKVPGRGDDLRLGLYVELPGGCINVTPPRGVMANGAYIERWSASCAGGLSGSRIHIAGLPATMTDVLVRHERLDGTTQMARLTPSAPSFIVATEPDAYEVIGTYVVLGIEHILLGFDHLLFVLSLLILVRGWRRLVGTITAFTVAHSITLGAATLGWVRVPGAPVEAVIALSIAFVACEIVHRQQGRSGLAGRWPWVVAFTFGLLHGLGFANALHEVGLPQNAIPFALLAFNVGVEVGQLLFIGAVMAAYAAVAVIATTLRWAGPALRLDIGVRETVVAYAIGTTAAFWVIERTLGFFA